MHHQGGDAAGLLAGWTVLWHPSLIAASGQTPQWQRVDDPPAELSETLIVVPSVSTPELRTGFPQRAADAGALVIQDQTDRDVLWNMITDEVDELAAVDAELVADFFALSYAFLQVEILTRQMRYSSSLDEVHFRNLVSEAAQAAVENKIEPARNKLTACFDLLAEERDHYYAVDAYLLDLTLLASSTLAEPLSRDLAAGVPTNLMLTGEVAEQLEAYPDSLQAIRDGIQQGRIGIVGGEYSEGDSLQMSAEDLLGSVRRGTEAIGAILGQRPTCFARRKFGLVPLHVPILANLGYRGLLFFNFDRGQMPQPNQAKIRWEIGSAAIDAFGRRIHDASRPETFLSFAATLSDTMDMDQVATVCVAHWPGPRPFWYEDFRRVCRFGNLLGKATTVEAYFEETDAPYHGESFGMEQWRSQSLKNHLEADDRDPLSRWIDYWRDAGEQWSANAREFWIGQAVGQTVDPERSPVEQLAEFLQAKQEGASLGRLLTNSDLVTARQRVELESGEELPPVERPVYATQAAPVRQAVVDVPAMGFAWIGQSSTSRPGNAQPGLVLADEEKLFNEFFEVRINRTTGALQSVNDYETRGNRVSQQLAVRWVDAQGNPDYSVMAADQVEITQATELVGQACVTGRLLNRQGETLADFKQWVTVERGNRIVELDIELEPRVELPGEPWQSYVASRLAWADDSAELYRCIGQQKSLVRHRRIESPNYVEMDGGPKKKVTLFSGGLPYHQWDGRRMLDTLLIVKGETRRRFRLGIGIEVDYPQHAMLARCAPQATWGNVKGPIQPQHSWLFRTDAKNLLATHWEPVVEGDRFVGFQVRLLETMGLRTKAALSCFREIAEASVVSFEQQVKQSLNLEQGKIRLDLSPHDWIQVAARFA